MKTVIVFILVAISNGSHNYGTVTPIMEYQTEQACKISAEKRKPSFSAIFYLDCLEVVKEVESD